MIKILPLRLEFCDRLARIAKECLPENWSSKEFENTLHHDYNLYYVACNWESETVEIDLPILCEWIVGFAGIMMVADEAELLNIAVLPECREQGIGTMLLQKLFYEAKEHGMWRMLLEVREGNRMARNFYCKHGFSQLALREGYYSDPKEDAIIMECILKNPLLLRS